MGLSMQYFVIYTLLANDQTGNQFTNNAHLGVQKILETACTTTYAAMLSVLFLAALMLAIQLMQDETKKYKMPQPWAQTTMFCCMNAVPTQVSIGLIIPALTYGRRPSATYGRRVGGQHGRAQEPRHVPRRERKVCCHYLVGSHYVTMLMLYGGFITVNATVFMKQRPKEARKNECPSRRTSSWRCARRLSRSAAPRRSP